MGVFNLDVLAYCYVASLFSNEALVFSNKALVFSNEALVFNNEVCGFCCEL